MDIHVRNFSDEELDTFQEEINSERSRRKHIDKLVDNINELLYKLSGELSDYEWLAFVHNQSGKELFNTKDIEESQDFMTDWFAPHIIIEREE